MRRALLIAVAATFVALPAAGHARDDLRLRGTVTATSAAEGIVTVTSRTLVHRLRVPGSLERIRIGRRVELRGTTLRARGNGSRVLARGVLIVSSERRIAGSAEERVEVHGRITSLAPLTVATVTCAVPAGVSIAGFVVGEFVEMDCVLVGTTLTLRRLESEDVDRDEEEDEDEDEARDRDDDDDEEDDDRGRHGGGGHSGRG